MLIRASLVAGIMPLVVVFACDLAFGPFDNDDVYVLQALLGPPLVALPCAFSLGRRAAWVALGGVLIALALLGAVVFVLLGGGIGED